MADEKTAILMLLTLVLGIVGLAILDQVVTTTQQPTNVVNESIGTANASGYLAGSVAYTPLSTPSTLCNGVTAGANATWTGKNVVINGANCINDTVLSSYNYDGNTYVSGAITRTILTYAPVLFALGLLAAAGLYAASRYGFV